MESIKVWRVAILQPGSHGLSSTWGGKRARSCGHQGSARAPTRGNYLHHPGEVRHSLIYTSFLLLQAPGSTGMTHPEMQVL